MNDSEILVEWYRHNKRDLPWRKTNSPYQIWLSEIILQQTRVNQGLGYYVKFIEKYPQIEDLANASIDEILKLWQGLGYYTRARNLHETARTIVNEYNGKFPGTYNQLIKLKGIGPYTAAAIASIAFEEPIALVDGNVFRVLARYFGDHTPINSSRGGKIFTNLAQQLLDTNIPGIHNQALMEFGSLLCVPMKPHCSECPLSAECCAYREDQTAILPVKIGNGRIRKRYFNYLFIISDNKTYLKRRMNNDIWHSLYEFPLVETPSSTTPEKLIDTKGWKKIFGNAKVILKNTTKTYKHQLSHQIIFCNFYCAEIEDDLKLKNNEYLKVTFDDLKSYPVSRLIDKYLADLKREGLICN
jgi:A/G-specific adenine glycosylase